MTKGICFSLLQTGLYKVLLLFGVEAELRGQVSLQSMSGQNYRERKIKFIMCTVIGSTCFHSLTAEQINAALGP